MRNERHKLLGLTILTVLMTAGSLHLAGWFDGVALAAPRRALAVVKPDEALLTEAGIRYRTMQTRHWRHVVINQAR